MTCCSFLCIFPEQKLVWQETEKTKRLSDAHKVQVRRFSVFALYAANPMKSNGIYFLVFLAYLVYLPQRSKYLPAVGLPYSLYTEKSPLLTNSGLMMIHSVLVLLMQSFNPMTNIIRQQ